MTPERKGDDGNRIVEMLLGPGEPELTCEECFEYLDRFVELELRGADPDAGVPGMRAHLAGCPACSEEHRSLREFASQAPPAEPPAA